MKKLLPVIAAAAALIFASACSDYVGKENSHPLFSKGITAKTNRNYAEAAKAFEEFLMMCPKSAKTHYELATIYGDSLGDYIRAVYHYQKYMELSRLTKQDEDSIRHFIESCKRKEYERYQQENGLASAPAADTETVEKMTNKISALQAERNALRTSLESHIQNEERLLAEKKRLQQEMLSHKKAPAAARSTPAKTSARTASDTYTVQKNDQSLIAISRKIYGTPKYWKQLLDANKNQVGADGRNLRPGMVLKIPAVSQR